jgi:hypothetical protein
VNYDIAKHLLLLHGSGTLNVEGNPLVKEDGFLGVLRPYAGLKEENFHEVMEALFAIAESTSASATVDRELFSSVWWMCYLARLWGVEPTGMLRRNKLITENDVTRLARWIDVVEYSALHILSGNHHEPINTYAQYVIEHTAGVNAESFVPILARGLDCDANFHDPSTIATALGKLGRLARPALPQLRDAAQKVYRQCEPVEQFTAEVREAINAAIDQIEAT